MKITLAATCFIMGTLLAYVAANSDSDRTLPMAFVNDSAITTKIKANWLGKNCQIG